MGTLTAQILVGTPHQNHDGICPTHYLFLSENSRPCWMLVPENIYDQKPAARITWIPASDNMLEDALLMIAIHVVKDKEIVECAKKLFTNKDPHYAELDTDISQADRESLYQKCRKMENVYKIVLTVCRSSSILNQFKVLKQYKMDVEVCSPVYSRSYSAWTEKTTITGRLK